MKNNRDKCTKMKGHHSVRVCVATILLLIVGVSIHQENDKLPTALVF